MIGPPPRRAHNSKFQMMWYKKATTRKEWGEKKSYKSISKYEIWLSLFSVFFAVDCRILIFVWVHICRYVYLFIKWNYEPNTRMKKHKLIQNLPKRKISYKWVDECVRIMRNICYSDHFNLNAAALMPNSVHFVSINVLISRTPNGEIISKSLFCIYEFCRNYILCRLMK